MNAVRLIPSTTDPLIIRTSLRTCRRGTRLAGWSGRPSRYTFYANVEFLDDPKFRGLRPADLLARVPAGYRHSFLCVVDGTAAAHLEFPILVIDLRVDRGRSFRAIPSTIQGIENNLSISNMDFFEFADNGIFRGFHSH